MNGDAVSTNSGHCLNTLTVLKPSCFPAARIQDDGPSCSIECRQMSGQSCEKDYFPFITGQIRRDKRMLCRKKRLIKSHKRSGLRMDDDPVPRLS